MWFCASGPFVEKKFIRIISIKDLRNESTTKLKGLLFFFLIFLNFFFVLKGKNWREICSHLVKENCFSLTRKKNNKVGNYFVKVDK